MGLAVTAGGQQDITLGGASFHTQALTALGLGGAGANLEVALGGDPPVDSRLLVGPIGCRLCCAMDSAGMQDLASLVCTTTIVADTLSCPLEQHCPPEGVLEQLT